MRIGSSGIGGEKGRAERNVADIAARDIQLPQFLPI